VLGNTKQVVPLVVVVNNIIMERGDGVPSHHPLSFLGFLDYLFYLVFLDSFFGL
jgi:hypothetical protein